jgi:hypothetical protein
VDFAGGTPLSVVYFNPDAKIIISPDGGHAWTAFPENAAGFNAGLFTYTANASSIVRTTDAGNALFGLNDAAFVASTGVSNSAVTKSHKANETVAYAPQAGRVYASMDSSTSFVCMNQLGEEVAGDSFEHSRESRQVLDHH